MIVPEFKFWYRGKNKIYNGYEISHLWLFSNQVTIFPDGKNEFFDSDIEKDGVLLPVIPDLESASGDPYTMGDILFLDGGDGEPWVSCDFYENANKDHTVQYEKIKDEFVDNLAVLIKGDLDYWNIFRLSGESHGCDYYPPSYIDAECQFFHLKDKNKNIANIFTHAGDWPEFFCKTGIRR